MLGAKIPDRGVRYKCRYNPARVPVPRLYLASHTVEGFPHRGEEDQRKARELVPGVGLEEEID